MLRKMICQLIKVDEGTRSEPFTVETGKYKDQFIELLEKAESPELIGVLVVAEFHDDEQFRVSCAPVMAIERFIKVIESFDNKDTNNG